jgi:hypothetical protein
MRRRLLGVAALLVVAGAAVAAVLTLGKTEAAPAENADTFVPANALAYLHVSTDPARKQDQRLLAELKKFPFAAQLQERVVNAFGGSGTFDLQRDVRSWLGDEAAIALTNTGLLVVLKVDKEQTAQGVLARFAGAQPAVQYNGQLVRVFIGGAAALVDGYLLVGPQPLVQQAIDTHRSPKQSLAELPAYKRAAGRRPEDRAADAWITGIAAALALPARLTAAFGNNPLSASIVPTDTGVRIIALRLGGSTPAADFTPALLKSVPADAAAYMGLRGMRRLGAFLPTAAGAAGPTIAARLQPLLDQLDGEIAVSVAPGVPDPITTLTAHADDPATAREALADLQATIAATLSGSENDTGAVPTFEERPLTNDLDAYVLTLAGGGELAYAVAGSRVVISNADEGLRRAAADASGVADTEAYKRAVPDPGENTEALAFVATSQLLDLADAAGLNTSATYRAARQDLVKVQTIGATLRRQGSDTIAELNFLIP